ncbi:bifunctional non-homologous end joining protein LigD [Variovorax boronicumulans]|uniref:DNA ligase D n=1 Tax=Variovorax boronicumulans TaxID=436515 RepID=UPI0027801587|nr:DNA ligase D [Variovorax boronicumulans]MDP9991495.1 bifunctional non-homologous end joining protein LigD [Variovorax boronicumulans]MDQ0003141.1 bifunctional non-homologous end joining protein LigD [Variovorax boronicumulans]
MAKGDALSTYKSKRNFAVTAEPAEGGRPSPHALSFVVQKHAASRLHYDFRLELDGVMVSWAVPKGPSFDPKEKRMAIHVEDHPISYSSFEGTIPPKQYGAGTVIVWDNGTWEPVGDPRKGLAAGKLLFRLHGQKLEGLWELVNIAKGGERQEPWILFKKKDEYARAHADYDVVTALPDSVIAKPIKKVRTRASARSAASARPPPSKAPKPLARARVTALPAQIKPQLATLVAGVPSVGEWLYEIKFDGYRLMARLDNGEVALITRGGHDWAARMPTLVDELGALGLGSSFLDGEIVVLGPRGAPDFNALQNAFDRGRDTQDIVFFVFDAPFFEGQDLRQVPLRDRRQLLHDFLAEKASEHVRFSANFEADPTSLLRSACQMEMEGVIAKRADAPYVSRRSETWLKLKCKLRQEFVICGYTDRTDEADQVGSLLLGVHDDGGKLASVGSVGTGWSGEEAREIKQKLLPLAAPNSPFEKGDTKPGRWSRRKAGSERWVKPQLLAEVSFAEWTPDGQIRHASFIGLRDDKPAKVIVRERPKAVGAPAAAASNRTAAGSSSASITVTHGDRVIDATTGITKLDLVRYYDSVAEFILPHLKGRPCSLVRGPTGVTGQLFFQKHGEKIGIPGITELPESLWPGHAALLEIGNAKALAGAAQMNVIEFHTWNSTAKAIDKPDRMVFDLDPGEGTAWGHIQEAATLVRAMLEALGLKAWLKTSGGKGLHVVVPLAPRYDYETVKGFSQAIVQHMARTIPARFVAKSGPSNRVGKLFVDYLRNGHGATTAAAFSARARPGLGVSIPVLWDDLGSLKSGSQWNVRTAREHLSFQTEDPWAGYWKTRQPLAQAMKRLGYEKR